MCHAALVAVDANSAWSPSLATEFLSTTALDIDGDGTRVYMLEQPFPADLVDAGSPEFLVLPPSHP